MQMIAITGAILSYISSHIFTFYPKITQIIPFTPDYNLFFCRNIKKSLLCTKFLNNGCCFAYARKLENRFIFPCFRKKTTKSSPKINISISIFLLQGKIKYDKASFLLHGLNERSGKNIFPEWSIRRIYF